MASQFPALVLNADFRPLSYFPLSLWSWQDAIKAVFLDRVNIVSEYDTLVHSPTIQMRLPSVIALKDYVHLDRRPAFTRFNVFLRDRFRCQYCGDGYSSEELTFDHRPALARRPHDLGQCRDRLPGLQSGKEQPDAGGLPYASALAGGAADDLSASGKRPRLSAQLPARKLARLPVLGQRAGILGSRRAYEAFWIPASAPFPPAPILGTRHSSRRKLFSQTLSKLAAKSLEADSEAVSESARMITKGTPLTPQV